MNICEKGHRLSSFVVTQPHLLLKFALCRTEAKPCPILHLGPEPPTPELEISPGTRFGTRGSEVQILSPRPRKEKRYQRFRTREIAFLWPLLRAGRISAAPAPVDCRNLPSNTANPAPCLVTAAPSPVGYSVARPPLSLRSGSQSLSCIPILSCSRAQRVGN
jgi:hypothetical protein